MSGLPVVSCEGAPRDLGLDQGTACSEAIRERVRRAGGSGDWLGRWRPFGRGAFETAKASAHQVRRHFPHLDERVIGLARGARVPELALHHLLALGLGSAGEGASLRAAVDGSGRIVVIGRPAGILRSVQPDSGFASVEWTLPWLPGAFAGVNRAGLSGAVGLTDGERDGAEPAAAPAFLLLQNCLAQFATAENAVEWCERRPAGGHAQLVFADAAGGRAAIRVEGEKRAQIEPVEDALSLDDASEPGRLVCDSAARALEIVGPSPQRIEA